MKTLEEQIAAVKRELALRDRVYPNLIQRSKMTLSQAEWEKDAMRSVLHTLISLQPPAPVQSSLEMSS